jgi:hypothetical protein
MKRRSFPLFCCFIVFAANSQAQLQIRNIIFHAGNFKIANNYTYWDYQKETPITDTVNASYDFQADTGIMVSGQKITCFRYPYPPNPINSESNGLEIEVDTILRTIVSLSQTNDSKYYDNYPNLAYSQSHSDGFRIESVPYVVNKQRDTLTAFLDSEALLSISSSVWDYNEAETRFTSTRHIFSTMLGFEKNSFMSLKIIGSIPLAVSRSTNEFSVQLQIKRKQLIISSPIEQPSISCFDMMGRSYQLPLLYNDGDMKVLSLQTLPIGFYCLRVGQKCQKVYIAD